MAGWPSLDRVDDRRLAQSLRAGEPNALTLIYDTYAARLYDYCHALLRHQDDAASALGDSLIAAQEHIGKLREPERFRSWLYALVRNESLRRLAGPRPVSGKEAPEIDDAFIDAVEREHREDSRRLVHSALSGLSGRQREAVDLAVRHDLDAQELAGILGMSDQQATELVARARGDLDNALAAAIIARTGRSDCPSVAALVDEREWPLSPDVCRKLIRHIEACPVCAERRKRKVSTTRLLQVLPIASVPADLRPSVLELGAAADRHETRTVLAQKAEPFDVWGWPTSVDRNRRGGSGRGSGGGIPRLWPAIAAAAAVILVVGTVFLLLPGGSKRTGNTSPAAAIPASTSADPSSAAPTAPTSSPTKSKSKSPSPSPTSSSPSPIHSTHSTVPKPTHSKSKPPPPPSGTLSVSACEQGTNTCPVTLTAQNGTVHWSASPGSYVSVSPSNGTLSSGGSVTVTLTADQGSACGDGGQDTGSVSFSPNGSAHMSWTCGR